MKKTLIKNKSAWIVFIYDILSAIIAWLIVGTTIMGFASSIDWSPILFIGIAFAISSKTFRTYAALWETTSLNDLKKNIYATILGSTIFYAAEFLYSRLGGISRSEIVFFPLVALILSLAGRFFFKVYLSKKKSKTQKRLLVIGAGAGANLFLQENALIKDAYNVIACLDDNERLLGKSLSGVPIFGNINSVITKSKIIQTKHIDEVLIAIPSLEQSELNKMYKLLEDYHIPIKKMPSLLELTSGVKITALREVVIEDLLGRKPIKIGLDKIKNIYEDKYILITGGAGSIGSEICRQLLINAKPKKLIIFDHSEFNLYSLEQEMSKFTLQIKNKTQLSYVLGSITDLDRLDYVFNNFKIDCVFHAAAYKHVPLLESQPHIAIQNNFMGTKAVVDISAKYEVERFLLVSTDKAVNPTNVMGATKRLSELYVNSQKSDATRFMVTRFGNVLGSAGSVLPLFKKQLQEGGPLTVTHKEIERYFMTIPEASLLVILACAIGKGNQVFVLDMGKSIKITHLAEQTIRLAGKEPYKDIDIEFIGLRPGEKMFEELFYNKNNLHDSGYEKLMLASEKDIETASIQKMVEDLIKTPTKEKLFYFVDVYATNNL